jgi:hypothetical protein
MDGCAPRVGGTARHNYEEPRNVGSRISSLVHRAKYIKAALTQVIMSPRPQGVKASLCLISRDGPSMLWAVYIPANWELGAIRGLGGSSLLCLVRYRQVQ